MPLRLTTPVLTVDPAKIHEVDTRNAESLHGMWMVFSKCADFMEEGRRLENLSWRLWNRETFCVAPQLRRRQRVQPARSRYEKEVPELSTSVESAVSDETDRIESHIKCVPRDIKPVIVSEESVMSISRGRERHITSIGLEKMVYNIKEKKHLEPLETPTYTRQTQSIPTPDTTPRPSSPSRTPVSQEQPQEQQLQETEPLRNPQHHHQQQHTVRPHQSSDSCSTAALDSEHPPTAASDTSMSSAGMVKSSSVVRGFSPSHISSSYRSHPRLSATSADRTKATTATATLPMKSSPLKQRKGGMFVLGCSSGDEESSFEDRLMNRPQRSSLADGLRSRVKAQVAPVTVVEQASASEDALESDDDEEISESAIEDDDDSSEWEDSITESGRSSVEDDKPLFQRVDSRPNLVSRPSLLTMMMHQPQSRNGGPHSGRPGGPGSHSTPALQRSQLATPNRNSTAASASPDDDDDSTLTMKGPDVPRAKPIFTKPIPCHSIAHSPRTTRRNMLATELTESLRRHLLLERQQKTTSATTPFRRRHTAHDMANLQEYPGPQNGMVRNVANNSGNTGGNNHMSKDKETSKNNSWNHYFDYGPWEYHDKGW